VAATVCLALPSVGTAQDASGPDEGGGEPGTTEAVLVGPQAQVAADEASGGLQVIVHERGRITGSTDAAGTVGSSSTLTIEKPAGATLRRAVLFAASTGFTGPGVGDVSLDGQVVTFPTSVPSNIESVNYWADVTDVVRAKVDGASAGGVAFTVSETAPQSFDGVTLATIFDDPAQAADRSVSLLFGAMKTAGDTFTLHLAAPIDLGDPNLIQQMSLGISYGYQQFGTGQYSEVDVNGSRLTSSAGGEDDGEPTNGALITVGGVGDSATNPDPFAPNTNPRTDDELYDLSSFVTDGATQITVDTRNPSADDNVFFASFTMNPPVEIIDTGGGRGYVAIGDSTTTGFSVPTCAEDRAASPYGCVGDPPAPPYPERIRDAEPRFGDLDRKGIWGYDIGEAVDAYFAGQNAEGPWTPQLTAAEDARELVTVSLGANDMEFSDIQYWLGQCIGIEQQSFLGVVYDVDIVVEEDQCRQAATDRATAPELSADMDTMFDILDTPAANGADVVITLYFNAYNDKKVVRFFFDRSCHIIHTVGDIIVSAINNELERRAIDHGFLVADFKPVFDGHGAGSDDSYVFGTECELIGALTAVDFDFGWPPVDTDETLREIQTRFDPHPNAAGTQAQSDTILGVL
jgi:hypothetical protein